jgi:hypothetical protein
MDFKKVAVGLGWFSIGLGVVELIAPRALARFLGSDRSGVVRSFGAREALAGVALLTQRNKAPWMWARVAGDVLDLAALVRAMDDEDSRANVVVSTAAVAGITALDVVAALKLSGGARA